jgi:L-ribulose-5-phosphate 3-epimerase
VLTLGRLKISVSPHYFSGDRDEGIRLAAQEDVEGVYFGASPDSLDARARRDIAALAKSCGLQITSLVLWGGEVDLCEPEHHDRALPQAKAMLQLAADIGCPVVTAHVGIMPRETDSPRWQPMVDACAAIAAYGEQLGTVTAIETGPEPHWVLKRLMETINSPHLAINLDPANFIIWPAYLAMKDRVLYDPQDARANFDPHDAAIMLAPWVVHTHAKDAIVKEDGNYQEVPLGSGWVDWPRYVTILQDNGFDGFFAIEREVGEDKLGDVRRAIRFLRTLQG